MTSYAHSGAFGDLIYSLPVAKHFGPGEFYIKLNAMDWIGQHYYNSQPDPFHRGRLRESDFELIKPLIAAQDYITHVGILDPNKTAITHNLDRFRTPFVGHPGNYVDIYAGVFGITDPGVRTQLRTTPWLTVPHPLTVPGRSVVINRSARWQPHVLSTQWDQWRHEGLEAASVFIGLPQEHAAFEQATGWSIPYQPTRDLLEVAQYIRGATMFIGNQSVALSIAIGLGVAYCCEARSDLPLARNEVYFPDQPKGVYF